MDQVRPNKATRDLWQAVQDGDPVGVVSAIERGADANEKDATNAPPLLNAVRAGDVSVVGTLLTHGSDPNQPLWGEAENTILKWAVRGRRSDCAVALVEAGAKVSAWVFKDAAERGLESVVRTAVAHGVDINAATWDGTALIAASYHGNTGMVGLLLELKADANANTRNGWVPLMSAAARGYVSVVRLLLAAGANPSAQDKDGDTAMTFAAEKEHTEIVQMLREAGAGE